MDKLEWTVTVSADDSFSTPGSAITTLSNPVWVANGPNSNWVSILAEGTNDVAGGSYVYETTFDLTGVNLSTAAIVGRYSPDNAVSDVLINGTSTGISGGAFDVFTPFAIDRGFIAGVNTLEFVTVNGGDPSPHPHGLRVEMKLNSTAKEGGPVSSKSP